MRKNNTIGKGRKENDNHFCLLSAAPVNHDRSTYIRDYFFAILNFFMVALDAQQNFMPTKYNFFFFLSNSLLDQKL